MKRFLSLILVLILISCLWLPAFAVDSTINFKGDEWTVIDGSPVKYNSRGVPYYEPKYYPQASKPYSAVTLALSLPNLNGVAEYTLKMRLYAKLYEKGTLTISLLYSKGDTISQSLICFEQTGGKVNDDYYSFTFKMPEGVTSCQLLYSFNGLGDYVTSKDKFYAYDISITGYNISEDVKQGFDEVNKGLGNIQQGIDGLNNAGSDKPPLDTDITAFKSAIDKMNGWLDTIDNFVLSINTAADSAQTYISKGTEIYNSFFSIAPVALTVLVGFSVVFLVVRKIVGR